MPGFDEVVHQRVRLAVMAVLHSGGQRAFGELQDFLELTAGNLSRHLSILERAGYVAVIRQFSGRRPLTTVKLTPSGSRAYICEVQALRALIDYGGSVEEADRNDTGRAR